MSARRAAAIAAVVAWLLSVLIDSESVQDRLRFSQTIEDGRGRTETLEHVVLRLGPVAPPSKRFGGRLILPERVTWEPVGRMRANPVGGRTGLDIGPDPRA